VLLSFHARYFIPRPIKTLVRERVVENNIQIVRMIVSYLRKVKKEKKVWDKHDWCMKECCRKGCYNRVVLNKINLNPKRLITKTTKIILVLIFRKHDYNHNNIGKVIPYGVTALANSTQCLSAKASLLPHTAE